MAMTRRELRALRTESGAAAGSAVLEEAPVRVLMVCTGNVVRSPFLAHLFGSLDLPGLTFGSAGVRAVEGAPASGRIQELAQVYGLDLSEHRARRLGEPELAAASVVVCAARDHKKDVLRLDPGALNRIVTLRELARAAADLAAADTPAVPAERWGSLVERATRERRATDDDDIPDPYRLGDRDWWAFEEAAFGAALPVMRHLVGAAA